jgi:16S rRNA (uracil1498-N3)-methyltransferase
VGASRFFIDGIYEEGATVAFERGDAHKIVHVLRLEPGDGIRVIDSSGSEFDATIAGDAHNVLARIGSRVPRHTDAHPVRLTLAQAIPKGQKMEFVIEKASELGVTALLPFTSERTVVRDFGTNKIERWRRVAKSSAEQSGRRQILDVADPLAFSQLLERFAAYDAVLFPWEASEPAPLRTSLPPVLNGARRVLAVIGPEGGFSHDEASAAEGAGASVISLGPRILRTETAGLYLAAVIDFLTAS